MGSFQKITNKEIMTINDVVYFLIYTFEDYFWHSCIIDRLIISLYEYSIWVCVLQNSVGWSCLGCLFFVGAQNGGKKKKKKMYIFLKALGVGKFFLLLFVCLEFLG